uniref:Antixoidant peptide n=1 Tax=Odorrana andersonii TaxID=369514 RepID=K7WHQ5_ODOAN|nr:antixoidant peptide precursor [Odorrana andersonii]
MFPLKKTLLLLFFFGIVPLAFCEPGRDSDEEENEGHGAEANFENLKRSMLNSLSCFLSFT